MGNPRLHPRTLDAVKEKADIVDIVGEHVVLKKKGKEFVGICPFHDDSRPSMTVSPAKQFYFCFSCGAGGNSIKAEKVGSLRKKRIYCELLQEKQSPFNQS